MSRSPGVEGLVRSIGMSNLSRKMMEALASGVSIKPAVLQVGLCACGWVGGGVD